MRLLIHVGRLIRESLSFSFATRRFAVVLVIIIGLLLLLISLTAETVAPSRAVSVCVTDPEPDRPPTALPACTAPP